MAAILKRKTKDGHRYDVSYRGPDGRERSKTWRTRKDAIAFAATVQADLVRGQWVDPRGANRTFAAWAAQWLQGDPNKRPKTLACDEDTIRLHLNPTLGAKALGSITPNEIRGLVNKWTVKAAPSTVRRRYAVLRAILTTAVEADLIGRSPCRGIKLPSVEPKAHHVVTPAELEALAGAVGPEYKALVHVGAMLGLRFSECAGLRVRNLDLLRQTISIEESLSEVRGQLIVGRPKSAAGRRSMRMPDRLNALLAAHLASRGLTAKNSDEYVFAAPAGGPLRYAAFRSRVWVPACRNAGVTGLGFHDLRRTAATVLIASGVDVRTAQNRLGHSDPRLTIGLYAQVSSEADERAANSIGDHFANLTPLATRGATS